MVNWPCSSRESLAKVQICCRKMFAVEGPAVMRRFRRDGEGRRSM